jgi:ketosteroid isomerase-like protein
MSKELPAPLRSYFAAKNGKDIDSMLASFLEDAIVKDEGRIHVGRAAIREWMEETTRKYGVSVEVSDVEQEGDTARIAALVSGNFPGSPATLHYTFELSDDRIAGLEIGA